MCYAEVIGKNLLDHVEFAFCLENRDIVYESEK